MALKKCGPKQIVTRLCRRNGGSIVDFVGYVAATPEREWRL